MSKKTYALAIIGLFFLALAAPHTVHAMCGWIKERIEGWHPPTRGGRSIAVNKETGEVWLAYAKGPDLIVSKREGGTWTQKGVIHEGDVDYPVIALDSKGYPHIAYFDENDQNLKYAYYDGTNWHSEVVDSEGDVGTSTSIALDSQGRPHISYHDSTNKYLKYAYYDGTDWHTETVDSEYWGGGTTCIALDSQDHPHISYRDSNSDLKYAYYDGAKWHIEVVDFKDLFIDTTSIALDSQDHPHISYIDDYNDYLKYAYYDGAKWHIEVVDPAAGGLERLTTSIALDSQGHPHISYYDGTNDELKYAYYDGTNWHIETVDSEGGFWNNSIALDSQGHPHISYYDGTNDELKYAYYDGTKWNLETVDSVGNVGEYTSIALDSKDYPHISYLDSSNADLKYAYYDGTNWHTETVDSEGGVGWDTSIALDSQNHPHITYCDLTNSDLKYAYYDGTNWHIETVDSEGWVGTSTSIALDSQNHPHISYFDDYNDDLKYAYYDGTNWHIEAVDYEDRVGMYTSIALDSKDHPHISYIDYINYDLKYAYYDGTNWHIETVDSESGVGSRGTTSTSIALDSKDHPHISYIDDINIGLKYAYYDGTNWHIETVDSEGWINTYTSIALDSKDHPHISYFVAHTTIYFGPGLKYAYYDGTKWNIEAVDLTGWYISITLDSQDHPHISYCDCGDDALKYAHFPCSLQGGDDDGDGVSDEIEDAGPNGGDGNYNGIPDRNESDVTTLPTATGNGYMTVVVSGCTELGQVSAYQAGQGLVPNDPGFNHPYGLVGFDIPCSSATITIYFHNAEDLSGMTYRKYGPTPPGFDNPHWYMLPGVEFGVDAIGPYARFTLTDGGLGDDIPGDGRITDQGGPGRGEGPPAAIPTLNEWGMLIMMLLMAAVAIWFVRRGRQAG